MSWNDHKQLTVRK